MLNKQEIAVIARQLISFCTEHNIDPRDSLANESPIIQMLQGESVRIEAGLRPSVAGTKAYTLSYIVQGLGIPIEVRLNPFVGQTKIIVKANEVLSGYVPFGGDRFGNVYQERNLAGVSMDQLTRELERLADR